MKLIASLTSPYARKIRIVLAEKALPFELVQDSPWEPSTRVPERNPLGKIPVLVADDGEVFFDSPVVAAYLETLGGALKLVPDAPLAAVRVRQTEALADGLCDAAVTIRLESMRPAEVRDEANIARQTGKVLRALDALEVRLGSAAWFNGDTMQLGDIAVGVALGYVDFRLAELDWRATRPTLAAFAARMHARPSFASTVPPA